MSGVRLDSYIYTVDALREARFRLKDDGVIFMSFSLLNQQMNRKMDLMLTQAFDGQEPLCYQSRVGGAAIFIAGKHVREHEYALPGSVPPCRGARRSGRPFHGRLAVFLHVRAGISHVVPDRDAHPAAGRLDLHRTSDAWQQRRILIALLSPRRGIHAPGNQGDHRTGAVLWAARGW